MKPIGYLNSILLLGAGGCFFLFLVMSAYGLLGALAEPQAVWGDRLAGLFLYVTYAGFAVLCRSVAGSVYVKEGSDS